MTTLTRATLGKLTKRQVKDVTIGDDVARIQRPTPLELSQYLSDCRKAATKASDIDLVDLSRAIQLLVCRMWIDNEGNRLFKDSEVNDVDFLDPDFYGLLSSECQSFAMKGMEASKTLGESEKTVDSDSPAESVLSLE